MKLHQFDYLVILLFGLFLLYLVRQALKTKQVFPVFFTGGAHTHWVSIALSILSMNISFEYIFSSSANGFKTGLPYACYEWTAIPVIVFVAYYIIPRFIRLGINTLPEYLEHRFNKATRVLMAVLFLFATLALAVLSLSSCGEFMLELFDISKNLTVVVVALIGAAIMYFGGASARIKVNVLLFSFFFMAGLVLLFFCIRKVGGLDMLVARSDHHLDAIMPADSEILPWKALFLGDIWVLHLNYWAFYPPIAHVSLPNRSLSNTQKALMLVASVKVVAAFIMIIPGVVGFELYRSQIVNPEYTLTFMIGKVVPGGFEGFVTMGYLATLFTTFCVIVNTAASLFTLDIYGSIVKKNDEQLIEVARVFIIMFVVVSIIGAFEFDHNMPFFKYATLILELIAPITTSVFLVAIYTKRTPALAATLAIVFSLPAWWVIRTYMGMMSLNVTGVLFLVLTGFMLLFNWCMPLQTPVVLVEKYEVRYERSLLIVIWGIFLITISAAFYAVLI